MSDQDSQLTRMALAVQFMQRDVHALMTRGTELEIELALKQAEVDRLLKELENLKQAEVSERVR